MHPFSPADKGAGGNAADVVLEKSRHLKPLDAGELAGRIIGSDLKVKD